MKPYITKTREFICSSCVSRFEEEYLKREMDYCPRCGVRIDWDFGTIKYITIKLNQWIDGENTKEKVIQDMIEILREIEEE